MRNIRMARLKGHFEIIVIDSKLVSAINFLNLKN